MDSSPSSPIPIGDFPFGLLIFFLLLLVGGAYFAGAETSLSSVNRIRIMSMADNGDKRARRVLYILDHFDQALSTILIGTNIMQIGCASLATLVATRLWGAGVVGLTSIVTTLIVFLLAEMIPKSISKACNERFALFVASSLLVLMRALSPVVKVFTAMTNGLKKLFRPLESQDDPTVTEDELHTIIRSIQQDSAIDDEKSELMQSALEFTETEVGEAYTPWSQVQCVSTAMSPREIAALIDGSCHSRLPVVDGTGAVVGVLQIRKYLREYIRRSGHVSLLRVMDKPHFVQEGIPIDALLEAMSARKTHIAVVRDENEKLLGIITVEDILEELVGEIYDEDDVGGEQLA